MDKSDCGPTCLKILSKYYGKDISLEFLRRSSFISREGVSFAGIQEAAKNVGFESFAILVDWNDFANKVPQPCIVHWQGNHFIVVYRISNTKVFISDPSKGKYTLSIKDFKKGWLLDAEKGAVMLLEPNSSFYLEEGQKKVTSSFTHLTKYLANYKKLLWQLGIGLFLTSIILLTLPFFTQSIVDFGIENQDLNFIKIILLAQVIFVITQVSTEVIRDWILLHISIRVNIRMMSDYLSKLVQLPVSFFTGRSIGDLIRRINDNERIQEFLTNGSLTFVFDIFSILLFGIVLAYYNVPIFIIFLIGSIIYLFWSLIFMKRKALLDGAYFGASAKSQSKILQLINNIEDIKVNGSQERRKSEWYESQLELFDVTSKNLRINQAQLNGGQLINELKNILIIFYSAKGVINGSLSLGVMLAIQFIIGQLNVPLTKLIDFLLDYQKAALSSKRLLEVQNEIPEGDDSEASETPIHDSIFIENLSFHYGPPGSSYALRNVSFTIPKNQITAIVGHSGSGKTTLLKLLLNFYKPVNGKILSGNAPIDSISPQKWREFCGVVLQDGKLFNDTIERNITESRSLSKFNKKRYEKALEYAMLSEFVNELPHKSQTRIGENGINLSGGEKQRMLIARAIYKNPKYIFLDEATSSLDTINESKIKDNLQKFFKKRTVVIIAHRLSTIRNAHNIVVLNKGLVVEEGTHDTLIKKREHYWKLVQSQMDIVIDE